MIPQNEFLPLYSQNGELIAVLVGSALWEKIEQIVPELSCKPAEQERPEPISDWELLKDYWDFKYPLDLSVQCNHCGNQTDNWELDDPRKFTLRAASLGGLVNFECMNCKSRIIKRHFKDCFQFECRPCS